MRDDKTHPIRLYLTETRDNGYYHLTATVVEIRPTGDSEAGIRNVDWTKGYCQGLFVDDFEVRCQGDSSSRVDGDHRAVYGWELTFKPFCVDIARAERMVKTLKSVQAGMERLTAKVGSPATYGQYLGRVALVLGCEGFVVLKAPRKNNGWSNYNDMDHRFMSLSDGIDHADYMIRQWVQEGREAVAVA